MKHRILPALLLAAFAGAAGAQSAGGTNVQLYGIVDVGVEWADNGRDSAFRVESGLASTSRFGIRGTEDLGAGLKGVFTLEAGVAADNGGFNTVNPDNANGAAGGAGAVAGFNRQAFVGVQGGFGTITLGRQYTPGYLVLARQSVFGFGLAGNITNIAVGNIQRVDNSIVYASPTFGGLKGTLMYGAGAESFTGTTARRFMGVGLEFATGPFSAGAYWQRQNGFATAANATSVNPEDREFGLGASYKLGVFTLNAGYFDRDVNANAITNGDLKAWWVGGAAKVGPGDLLVQYGRINAEVANRDGNSIAVAYLYPFSRRTTLYTSFGRIGNDPASVYGLQGAGNTGIAPAVAGADPKSFMLGVRHNF